MELYRAVAEGNDAALQPDATVGIAQLMRADGKPKDARRLLERVLAGQVPPASEPTARLELARCRLDEGDADAALAELSKAAPKAQPALADDFAYWSARCEARLGKYAEAAARLDGCDTRFARSELLAEMLYERADALSHTGRQQDADAALATLRKRFRITHSPRRRCSRARPRRTRRGTTPRPAA